jgi:hypothetical protein
MSAFLLPLLWTGTTTLHRPRPPKTKDDSCPLLGRIVATPSPSWGDFIICHALLLTSIICHILLCILLFATYYTGFFTICHICPFTGLFIIYKNKIQCEYSTYTDTVDPQIKSVGFPTAERDNCRPNFLVDGSTKLFLPLCNGVETGREKQRSWTRSVTAAELGTIGTAAGPRVEQP